MTKFKYNSFYIIFIASLITHLVAGEIQLPDKIGEYWIAQKPVRKFTGEQLFSHINGGAELFLEYGFKNLTVCQYSHDTITLETEVYQMETPLSALGIYLSKTGQETPLKEISARNTANLYQVIATKGSYFIMVNNFSGNKHLVPIMVQLSESILSQIQEQEIEDIFSYLPEKDAIEDSKIIFRGPFGLQSVYTFGKGDVLLLRGKIFGVSANYSTDSATYITKIVIPYPDPLLARKAYEHLISHLDPYHEIMVKADNYFIFKNYHQKFGKVSIKKAIVRMDLHLNSIPNGSN